MIITFFQSLLFYVKCFFYILARLQMNVTIVIMSGNPETRLSFINKIQKSSRPKTNLLENGYLLFLLTQLPLDFKSWAKHTGMRRSRNKLDNKPVLQRKLLKAPYKEKIENKWSEQRWISSRICLNLRQEMSIERRSMDTYLWDTITPPIDKIQPSEWTIQPIIKISPSLWNGQLRSWH